MGRREGLCRSVSRQGIMAPSNLRRLVLVALFALGSVLLAVSMITALVAMSAFTDPNPGPPLWNAIGAISFACFPIPGIIGALLWVYVALSLRQEKQV